MQLQSNLPILLKFDLNNLLAVQSDVTALISRRVRELLNKPEGSCDECLAVGEKCDCITSRSRTVIKDIPFKKEEEDDDDDNDEEEEEDSEAFILTQCDQRTREKLLSQENEELVIIQPGLPKPDISSPLKGSQSLADSLGYAESDLKEPCKRYEKDGQLSAKNTESRRQPRDNLFTTKKLCVRPPVVTAAINLNVNPLTGKPWILEDFKRNEDVNCIKNQRNAKLQKFYAGGHAPPEVGRWSLKDRRMEEKLESNFCEFDNLRERSHSPPGFGRLDFPNTQERFDDKRKSQSIIFQKTQWRFREATCNAIPPQERKYLFKNESLNEIIDNGTFEWNDADLQIYMR